MTMLVGLAAIVGTAKAIRLRSSVRIWPALGTMQVVAALQIAALWLSLQPLVAHR
jgi:hypothetical protein